MIRRLVNRLRIRVGLKVARRLKGRQEGAAASAVMGATYTDLRAALTSSQGLFSWGSQPDPSRIPDDAKSKSWESCHLFPAGTSLCRTDYGLNCSEPPLAMVCPECDLKQPALHQGQSRVCGYCGSNLQSHGSRIFAWSTAQPEEWTYEGKAR